MKWLRRLYDWVLSWAETPYANPALFLLAFTESSFFPVPPDVLQITLSYSKPKKSYQFATISAIGSVLGGAFGYFIGWQLFEAIGVKILTAYGLMSEYARISALYNQYNALAVGLAGFTPIPYKLFTIAAGACKINFPTFIIASAVSRSMRFFLVATLFYFFGEKVRTFIEKYFNLLTVIFALLLIGGFIMVKFVIK